MLAYTALQLVECHAFCITEESRWKGCMAAAMVRSRAKVYEEVGYFYSQSANSSSYRQMIIAYSSGPLWISRKMNPVPEFRTILHPQGLIE